VLESMALNDSRDLCKINPAELRRTGKPVPRFCGAHGKGEPDCLMQLLTLTMCEHLNIMLSIAMGEARDWLEDPDHPYKRSQENCLPLKMVPVPASPTLMPTTRTASCVMTDLPRKRPHNAFAVCVSSHTFLSISAFSVTV
jgi:hypothetical protein